MIGGSTLVEGLPLCPVLVLRSSGKVQEKVRHGMGVHTGETLGEYSV